MQVDVLVLDAFPESFDEYVVDPAPLAVHTDLDALGSEHSGELLAGELAPLIGVEDLGCSEVASVFRTWA